MPEAIAGLLALEGLGWIAAAALIAGLVRGFSGFGTAMIYLPVATQFLPPFWAIATLALMGIGGPLPNLRGAWAVVNRRDLALLLGGTAVSMPLGLWALSFLAPETFRWAVSLLALSMLVLLVSGLRYRGAVSDAMVAGTGVAGGFLGGVAGVPGPPVILFYMARPLPAAVIRATTLLYLFGYEVLMILYLGGSGHLLAVPVLLGLLLTLPNLLGNWLGGLMFIPGYERLYRAVAYIIILISALSGLPVWG
jgi:uncharacterized membrane protein YfcA